MVWLPGAFQGPEDFLAAGFDAAVRARGLPLDLEFVDLEPAHLSDRDAIGHLASEVIAPARARGCRSVWLAGISLGGYVALDFASTHPDLWDGLCVLAPYLGPRDLLTELAADPQRAVPLAAALAQSEPERRIWRFVQARSADARPCFLGFGRDDRYLAAHVLMSEALSPEAVRMVPGGHDWLTWRRLWELFLDSRWM